MLRLPVLLAAAAFAALAFAAPRDASAYPFMVRHGYPNCAQCHADPSGGGLLTPYGRAQGEITLRTVWGERDPEEWEPGKASEFAFGLVDLPKELLLGVASRSAVMYREQDGEELDPFFLQMQSDLRGQVTVGRVRAYGSVALLRGDKVQPAWLTSNEGEEAYNAASREHWIGVDVTDSILVRAGRMNLPFGMRNLEHTSWVRSATRTDLNDTQQHGVSTAFNLRPWRGEVMAIAGNYQVSPDAFRERGYSLYVERAIGNSHAIGVSSLATHAQRDLRQRVELTRQAHGLFARTNFWNPLVLFAEADLLVETPKGREGRTGFAGLFQADYEPIQGVHLVGMGEILNRGAPGEANSYGAWASVVWFVLPHVDLRLDLIRRSVPAGPRRSDSTTVLTQLHFFL